jgi:hypothetical protein
LLFGLFQRKPFGKLEFFCFLSFEVVFHDLAKYLCQLWVRLGRVELLFEPVVNEDQSVFEGVGGVDVFELELYSEQRDDQLAEFVG